MNKLFAEILGWYGAIALILAYVIVSFNIAPPSSLVFQLLNLTGGIGIIIISLVKKAYQPAALNIVFVILVLIAIFRIIF